MDAIPLTWDSHFLGYSVGKIDLSTSNKDNSTEEVLSKSKRNGYQLIYTFILYPKVLKESTLSKFNGLLIDSKVTYSYNIKTGDNKAIPLEEYMEKGEDLYDLAYDSGIYSRFLFDISFGIDKFRSLYRKWIDNSLTNKRHKIFVYRNGDKIIGFVTLKKHRVSIGLIAVNANYRGISIGKRLIEYCKKVTFENHISRLYVTTQLRNNTACSFYEKSGFLKLQIINIYHFWL